MKRFRGLVAATVILAGLGRVVGDGEGEKGKRRHCLLGPDNAVTPDITGLQYHVKKDKQNL